MKKIVIRTTWAFLIWAFLLTGGFVFTGFKPTAQFETFAMWLTIGVGLYTGKRLFQKKAEFNGNDKEVK